MAIRKEDTMKAAMEEMKEDAICAKCGKAPCACKKAMA